MKALETIAPGRRLFTYKVAFDAGNAPNPFGNVCTLAICKPAIRRVADVGDIIVGLAPGHEGRIVYCMQVTDKKSWGNYIDQCTHKSCVLDKPEYAKLGIKVPKSELDQGDCIWHNAATYQRVRPSHSGHEGHQDFDHDVKNGVNVLLSTAFWYFGKGDVFDIKLRNDLKDLVPGRGHRSNSNEMMKNAFVDFFNDLLVTYSIKNFGIHGEPELPPKISDKATCARCREIDREDDNHGEDK